MAHLRVRGITKLLTYIKLRALMDCKRARDGRIKRGLQVAAEWRQNLLRACDPKKQRSSALQAATRFKEQDRRCCGDVDGLHRRRHGDAHERLGPGAPLGG